MVVATSKKGECLKYIITTMSSSATAAATAASTDAAEQLRVLAGVARARNGRLATDWISRREKPRWKMIPLDGLWYNRERLRRFMRARPPPPIVPVSRRKLTSREVDAVFDTNPWRLARRSNTT